MQFLVNLNSEKSTLKQTNKKFIVNFIFANILHGY